MYTVQYIVVRKDLAERLGAGVIATQVAHAAVAPITGQLRADLARPIAEALDEDTAKWVTGIFRKVVVEVETEQKLRNLMERLDADGIVYAAIRESSLDGQLTCIGLKPYDKGRVAPYFKGLALLGRRTEPTRRLTVNGQDWPIDHVMTDASIGKGIIDPSNRFVLELCLSEHQFPVRIEASMKQMRAYAGCGDDFIDGLQDLSFVMNARRNDPRFSEYILCDYFRTILDDVFTTPKPPVVTLTSLDGMFALEDRLYIVGGCSID